MNKFVHNEYYISESNVYSTAMYINMDKTLKYFVWQKIKITKSTYN